MTSPDYVTTTLDQANKVRAELIDSAVRSYHLVSGAVNSAAQQVKPDLQDIVNVSFNTVEKAVARSRSFANSLVAATDRIGV
jgi:hypothetical protein